MQRTIFLHAQHQRCNQKWLSVIICQISCIPMRRLKPQCVNRLNGFTILAYQVARPANIFTVAFNRFETYFQYIHMRIDQCHTFYVIIMRDFVTR